MGDAHPNWKSLPVEILHQIFQYVNTDNKSRHELAFVCKAWKNIAQPVFYTKVTITTLSQLEKFYDTVKNNTQLGSAVKKIKLVIPFSFFEEEAKTDCFHLLTKILSTCVPNLERVKDLSLDSYIPVLNALEDSQLKHLNKLGSPSESEENELANYATCAFYMKDRIKKIEILENLQSEESTRDERLIAKRLYNKLNQFKALEKLEMKKKSKDEILVLEHVLDSCKTLKSLNFEFYPPEEDDEISTNEGISIDTISNVNPASNINTLFADINVVSDYKMLLYVMRKFPNLRKLFITIANCSSAQLDRQIFSQLLKYTSRIDYFGGANFVVDDHDIAETFAEYWGSTTSTRDNRVDFIYSDNEGYLEDPYLLQMINTPTESCSSFTYHISNMNRQHFDFFEKAGKFIHGFQIVMQNELNTPKFPDNFIPDILKQCPNIRRICITKCNLERPPKMDPDDNLSLGELVLDRCELDQGFFERLTQVLPEIKVLRLGGLIKRVTDAGTSKSTANNPDITIMIPLTRIEYVDFIEVGLKKPLYLRLFAVEEGNLVYFRIYGSYELVTEKDFINADDGIRAFICCRSRFAVQLST